jgi:hypothetical protein
MLNIRELSFDEIAMVSGGNANSNYEGGGSRRGGKQFITIWPFVRQRYL